MPSFFAVGDTERLTRLREQLSHAASSRFYADRLPGADTFRELTDISMLPFLRSADILAHGQHMVCVGGKDVQRIVSLRSSGTEGKTKRLYFSKQDLERTVCFFTEGMQLLCSAGDRVGVLFPCDTPDGLGDLLCRGLSAFGAKPLPQDGGEKTWGALCSRIAAAAPDFLIGTPRTLRSAALMLPELRPRGVLLSGDYVSDSLRELLAAIWDCEVFEHYGMTETGFGCAVENREHRGMLPRRDALLLEIVDETGKPQPDGCPGEIVVTTLGREAMPLLRYCTGDRGIMADGRLIRVLGRTEDALFPMAAEALDGNRDVLDYSVTADPASGRAVLRLYVSDENAVSTLPTGDMLSGFRVSVETEPVRSPEALPWRREKRKTIYNEQGEKSSDREE